jgi:hypothetical protein
MRITVKGFGSFYLVYLVCFLTLAACCVNYDLGVIVGKHIPFFWAFLLGLITGGAAIVVAIVLKVLLILKIIAAPMFGR